MAKEENVIIASEQVIEEIRSPVFLNEVLNNAHGYACTLLDGGANAEECVPQALLVLGKCRSLVNFLSFLVPLYPTLGASLVSKAKSRFLAKWTISHDIFRLHRFLDNFAVTPNVVHGSCDPVFRADRAVAILSVQAGATECLARWPFLASPYDSLQVEKDVYDRDVKEKYRKAREDWICRFLLREHKLDRMSIGIMNNTVLLQTQLYHCSLETDPNYYLEENIPVLPLLSPRVTFRSPIFRQMSKLQKQVGTLVAEGVGNIDIQSNSCRIDRPMRIHRLLRVDSCVVAAVAVHVAHIVWSEVVTTRPAIDNCGFFANPDFLPNPEKVVQNVSECLYQLSVPSLESQNAYIDHHLIQSLLTPIFAIACKVPDAEEVRLAVDELGGCYARDLKAEEFEFFGGLTNVDETKKSTVRDLSNVRTAHYALFFFRICYCEPYGFVALLNNQHDADLTRAMSAARIPFLLGQNSLTSASDATILAAQKIHEYAISISRKLAQATRPHIQVLRDRLALISQLKECSFETLVENDVAHSLRVVLNPTAQIRIILGFTLQADKSLDIYVAEKVEQCITENVCKVLASGIYRHKEAIPDVFGNLRAFLLWLLEVPDDISLFTTENIYYQECLRKYEAKSFVDDPEKRDALISLLIAKLNSAARMYYFSADIPYVRFTLYAHEVNAARKSCEAVRRHIPNMDNVAQNFLAYQGGYFIPALPDYSYISVTMWATEEVEVLLTLIYLVPTKFHCHGRIALAEGISGEVCVHTQARVFPIEGKFLDSLLCEKPYRSDFDLVYKTFNTNLTMYSANWRSLCLSRLHGLVAHIDQLLWTKALEKFILTTIPFQDEACRVLNEFKQTMHTSQDCHAEYEIPLYSQAMLQGQKRIPFGLQVLKTFEQTTPEAPLLYRWQHKMSQPPRQCATCSCDVREPCRIKYRRYIQIYLNIYHENEEQLVMGRKICLFNGQASYSTVFTVLSAVVPTIYRTLLNTCLDDLLPVHPYIEPLLPPTKEKRRDTFFYDTRPLTAVDRYLIINAIPKRMWISLRFILPDFFRLLSNHICLNKGIDLSGIKDDPFFFTIFTYLKYLMSTYYLRRGIRRCTHSFKLPSQRVPIVPSPRRIAYRQGEIDPRTDLIHCQRSSIYTDASKEELQLNDLYASYKDKRQYLYGVTDEVEVVFHFGATQLCHVITSHTARVSYYHYTRSNRNDKLLHVHHKYANILVGSFPAYMLYDDAVVHVPSSDPYGRLPTAKRFMAKVSDAITQVATGVGLLLRLAYLPVYEYAPDTKPSFFCWDSLTLGLTNSAIELQAYFTASAQYYNDTDTETSSQHVPSNLPIFTRLLRFVGVVPDDRTHQQSNLLLITSRVLTNLVPSPLENRPVNYAFAFSNGPAHMYAQLLEQESRDPYPFSLQRLDSTLNGLNFQCVFDAPPFRVRRSPSSRPGIYRFYNYEIQLNLSLGSNFQNPRELPAQLRWSREYTKRKRRVAAAEVSAMAFARQGSINLGDFAQAMKTLFTKLQRIRGCELKNAVSRSVYQQIKNLILQYSVPSFMIELLSLSIDKLDSITDLFTSFSALVTHFSGLLTSSPSDTLIFELPQEWSTRNNARFGQTLTPIVALASHLHCFAGRVTIFDFVRRNADAFENPVVIRGEKIPQLSLTSVTRPKWYITIPLQSPSEYDTDRIRVLHLAVLLYPDMSDLPQDMYWLDIRQLGVPRFERSRLLLVTDTVAQWKIEAHLAYQVRFGDVRLLRIP